MKKLLMIITLVLVFAAVTACSTKDNGLNPSSQADKKQTNSAGYIVLKPEDAKQYLENEKDIIILDVRTAEEYAEKHIPRSILIPVDDIEKKGAEILTNKDAKIFVYCRSGRRSEIAAKSLVEMGYNNIYDLGGIINWPYETETGALAK